MGASHSTVIARLDRATSTPRRQSLNREAAAYWFPAFAGNDRERGTGSVRAAAGSIPVNHCRQNCGAFLRLASIKPKYLPIRASRRRFLG
jgi:hypothetical protein